MNLASGAAPAFLRTHPITGERISDIQDRLKEYQYIQKSSNFDFYLVKAKLKVFLGDKEYIINYFERKLK
jgi:predicted Zn-dependent protease